MTKDYSNYQAPDFLTDDYFVESMLNPNPANETYWKELISNGKIDVNEFLSAYSILQGLHKQKPEVPENRVELLLNKIIETNRSTKNKKKRIRFFRYVIAACIVGVIGMSFWTYIRIGNNIPQHPFTALSNDSRIHTEQPSNQIQLISGNKVLEVEGVEANVEYDESGKLRVNHQIVNETTQADQQHKKASAYNELRVPYGKRAFLSLSDGTSLWINTGTTVIYPITFAEDKREIYIEGEVYAEVSHDEKRPFFIKTDKVDVKVLGTVFNVTAYKEDKSTNVVLVSGLVDVKPKNGKSTVIQPNQMLSYSEQTSTLTAVNVDNYTSWHKGVYIFKNEPIENILLRLSRYYNVTMKLPSNPSGISCTGKLELKDDLTYLLNGLAEITSMNFGVEDNVYKISFR